VSASPRYPYPFYERPEVAALVPPADRLLDVGCGRGGFGYALRAASVPVRELWGIEPSPEAAADAEHHFDRVIIGSYPDCLTEDAGRFDVVVFNDVLEHMLDPWSALEYTRDSVLTERGIVIASLPNIRFWPILWDLVVGGSWRYTETGTLDRTHLRFFTRSEMLNLFTTSGFEAESITAGYRLGNGGFRDRRYRLLPSELRTLQYLIVARRRG
jgi:2-polyprenyl-3-methyl-5-hydroxy-6-metoxy-1,4-benzoquinol methylase